MFQVQSNKYTRPHLLFFNCWQAFVLYCFFKWLLVWFKSNHTGLTPGDKILRDIIGAWLVNLFGIIQFILIRFLHCLVWDSIYFVFKTISYYFDILIKKIKIKFIVLIYFKIKNILKTNYFKIWAPFIFICCVPHLRGGFQIVK